MKRLFIIMVLLIGCHVWSDDGESYSNESIIGAFGLRLGDELTNDLAKQINAREPKESNGCVTYKITPTKPFSQYEKYCIAIAKKSRKIANIEAIFCSESGFRNLLLYTTQEISKKYGAFSFKREFDKNGEIATVMIFDRNIKTKYISIYSAFSLYYINITYCDYEILKSEQIKKQSSEKIITDEIDL